MGKVFDGIDDRLAAWIRAQALFFVGTAPLAGDGHVNVSPKGPMGALAVLDAHTVAYLDALGSGAETIAHVRENGRIVVMLCAFQGPPRIVRLHGRGEVVLRDDPRFDELLARGRFEDAGIEPARRSIIVVHLDRISDSCGYGVPRMKLLGGRPQLVSWGEKKLATGGREELDAYQRRMNATSIDGLPAIDPPGAEGSDAPR